MLTSHVSTPVPRIDGAQIAILQSKWYPEFTGLMSEKCRALLEQAGASVEHHVVPGCLEFPVSAETLLRHKDYDAIVLIGIVMKGETYHFEFILDSCVIGLDRVTATYNVPMINALLPVTTLDQIKARAGDNEHNKGIEAALAAAEYISWKRNLEEKVAAA